MRSAVRLSIHRCMKSFSTSVATFGFSLGVAGGFFFENMWHPELARSTAARVSGARRFMVKKGRLGVGRFDREGNFWFRVLAFKSFMCLRNERGVPAAAPEAASTDRGR